MQKDPDPGKLNFLATVVNSYIYTLKPSNLTVPNGRFPCLIALVVLGGAIQAGMNMSVASHAGASLCDILLSGLVGFASGTISTAGGIYVGLPGAMTGG